MGTGFAPEADPLVQSRQVQARERRAGQRSAATGREQETDQSESGRKRKMRKIERLFAAWPTGTTALLTAVVLAAGGPAWGLDREVTNENICNAVEDAMLFDRAAPYDSVDISCADGIVTLSGTANNILAKKRATRLAETIKGVRAVVNRITVEPSWDRTDAEIGTDVETALLSDPATDSYEITVEVDSQGHVTLSGSVESWKEKQLAETVAMGVKGVTSVTNNIDVNYKSDRTDREIRPDIVDALQWDALIDSELIDVKVKDGKVTLTGTVGSSAEKRQAGWDCWVAGVKEVDDSGLKVRNWARDDERRHTDYVIKPDSEIRDAINDAELCDPRVKSFEVEPKVTDGVVTLRGTVDNLKAKHAAAENARDTVGVSRVINRLKVRPAAHRTDAQLERAVRRALARDPYVDRYDITVNVVDGTAYLAGTVDSYFEKGEAEDAVTRLNGIVDVSNALKVTNPSWRVVYNPYVYDWNVYDYGWYDSNPTYVAKSDRDIKQDIEDELWWSPFVDSDEVTVTVQHGVATLAGTVDSWSERDAAMENAMEGGAIAVDNDLKVVE
jgi:osmotically-inducible protein OsmY